MRTFYVGILLFAFSTCFPQERVTGFYQLAKNKEGRLVQNLETGEPLYIHETPIFGLYDIAEIEGGFLELDHSHSLLFELKDRGAESLKSFTQANLPIQIALVLEDKVVSNASMHTAILDGRFSLSGFDLKKSKAVLNKLKIEMGKVPLFSKNNFLIYKNKAVYDDQERYNTQTDYETFMKAEILSDSNCTVFYQSYYHPLSLISTFYSYEFGEASEAACGTMGNTLGVTTIDIKTGGARSVLSVVEEQAFVAAFKKDPWVLKTLGKHEAKPLATIQCFQDILTLFEKDLIPVKFTESGFYILDSKNGNVKIRFVGSEYMGYNHYRHVQLGFELPIKQEAAALFKEDNNFYAGRFKNGLVE